MRNPFIYMVGGIACLAAGAYFYSSLPARQIVQNVSPAKIGILADDSRKETQNLPHPTLSLKERGNSIIFAGDVMLARSVAAQISKNGASYIFKNITDLVSSADYAVANLEGPITKINRSPENRMVFHFDPALSQMLVMSGFDVFSLANNHGLDEGSRGATETQKILTDAGLKFFGNSADDDGLVAEFTIEDKKFALIGAQDVYRKIDPATIAKKIAAAKEAGEFVVVYPHWGEEYKHEANVRQKELAHAFVDAGADLVVGSHPHVVQGIEIYMGKPIIYSLGNLVFDQYFSADTQEGLMIRLTPFEPAGSKGVQLIPYKIPQSQPVLAKGEDKTKMLANLASWSDPALKEQIEAGIIKF